MMGKVLRCLVLLTLVAMLAGHVSELFDHWDHTLRTGKDADYAVVMVAGCAGFVFAVAKRLLARARVSQRVECLPLPLGCPFSPAIFAEISPTGPSPPLLSALRI